MRSGRKAYGAQRQVSKATLARYIAESIQRHRALGQARDVRQYTADPETHRLVTALLTQAA